MYIEIRKTRDHFSYMIIFLNVYFDAIVNSFFYLNSELQAVIDELKPKCMIIHNSATFDIGNISNMEDSQGEDTMSTS